jgi:hypothetical protein
MQIKTIHSYAYEIVSSKPVWACVLEYKPGLSDFALFSGAENGILRYDAQQWKVLVSPHDADEWANITINHHSSMFLNLLEHGERWLFKRMGFWKTRFALINEQEEEILALLPKVNWQTCAYDFSVQLNDEFKPQLTPLISVICLHCAHYSLKMMNGEDTA